MKKRLSFVVMALFAMVGFVSLHAADPDPYSTVLNSSNYTAFNPAGNFSVQAKLEQGQSFEVRNASGLGFAFKAPKANVFSFLVDVTNKTVRVFVSGAEMPDANVALNISNVANSVGGEDLINAELHDATLKQGIYSAKNLLKNPSFEINTPYAEYTADVKPGDQRAKAADWSVLEKWDVATNCRTIEVTQNTGYAKIISLAEGAWAFMLHNSATPLWQDLGSVLKPNTYYKVAYRQMAHGDTSPVAAYTHYITNDSVNAAADNANVVASYVYNSAPQGLGNYVDVAYGFKTPATLASKQYFVIKRTGTGCINHFDRMTLQEITAADVQFGVKTPVEQITWEDGLKEPVGGDGIYEDVTAQYIANPSFENTNVTLVERSNPADTGNSGIWQPEGWTVVYSTTNAAPSLWDQGLVSEGLSGFNHDKDVNARTDTGFKPADGTYFYYFRSKWGATQDITLSQTLSAVPVGLYDLVFSAATDDVASAVVSITGAAEKQVSTSGISVSPYTLTFNIEEAGDINLKVSLVRQKADTEARLYLDNFRLIYRGSISDADEIAEKAKTLAELKTQFATLDSQIESGMLPLGTMEDVDNIIDMDDAIKNNPSLANYIAAIDAYTALIAEVKAAYETGLTFTTMLMVADGEEVSYNVGGSAYPGKAAYSDAIIDGLAAFGEEGVRAAELETEKAKFIEARKAYFLSAVTLATSNSPVEIGTAMISAPNFTKNGGDITLAADRAQGAWLTANVPAAYSEYRLHTAGGRNCWNNWHNSFTSMNLYQDIVGLPAGFYAGKALTATNGVPNDQHAYVSTASGEAVSPAATVQYTAGGTFNDEAQWEELTTTKVYLAEGDVLRIGFASTSGGGTSGWFCATGFELFYYPATEAGLKAVLDAAISEAKALIAESDTKIMGVEKTALNNALAAGESATGAEAIKTATSGLTIAVSNAKASVVAYDDMLPALVAAENLDHNGYSNEAVEALIAALTEQQAILAAAATSAADLPVVKRALEKAAAIFLKSYIVIPGNVSPENPFDLTSILVNPTIEAADKDVVPDGWTITRTDGDKNSTVGQHYSGDTLNRYLDSWNSTAGKVKFTVKQSLDGMPNGTYRLVCAARTSGAGSYLYAIADGLRVTEIQNFGNIGGPIWEAAPEGSDAKKANPDKAGDLTVGRGWGWQWVTVDNINVNDNYLTVGVTCDQTVSLGKVWDGGWFSADDFKLYYISKDFYGVGVDEIDANATPALNAYVENGYIKVDGVDSFEVKTISGVAVSADAQLLPGLYIVTSGGKSVIIAVGSLN